MRILPFIFITTLAFTLTGCSSQAESTSMVPDSVTAMSRHKVSVSTTVTGGEDGKDSKLTNAAFRNALEATIKDTRIFEAIDPPDEADYHLTVHIKSLRTKPDGLQGTATLLTEWTLEDPEGTRLWRDVVSRQQRVDLYDYALGGGRERVAVEGAVRETIETGLERAALINLNP